MRRRRWRRRDVADRRCGAGGGGNLSQRPAAAVPLFDDSARPRTVADDERGRLAVDHRRLARRRWRHATVTLRRRRSSTTSACGPAGESSRFAGNQKMSIRIKFDAFDGQREVRRLRRHQRQGRVRRRIDDARAPGAVRVRHVDARAQGGARDADRSTAISRGVFTLREDWDETSIAEHFSQPVGPLYRIRPPSQAVDPYVYISDDPPATFRSPWDRQIKKAARGDEVVAPFLKAIAGPVDAGDRRRRRQADGLPRRQRDRDDHRRPGGQQRRLRPLPVLRSAVGEVLRPALGSRQHLRLAGRDADEVDLFQAGPERADDRRARSSRPPRRATSRSSPTAIAAVRWRRCRPRRTRSTPRSRTRRTRTRSRWSRTTRSTGGSRHQGLRRRALRGLHMQLGN